MAIDDSFSAESKGFHVNNPTRYDPKTTSVVSELFAYLVATPFEVATEDDMEYLSGGSANFSFRLKLRSAYCAGVKEVRTAILKHAKPYVKAIEVMKLSVERQRYEVAALRHVRSFTPADSFVTVPEVYLHDDQVNVIIMEDIADDSSEPISLKDYIRRGSVLSSSLSAKIGSSLAIFLARLHKWDLKPSEKELFNGNKQTKELSAFAAYGQLLSTLNARGEDALVALKDAPLEISQEELKELSEVQKEGLDVMLNRFETFVMGDFWTGNIVLRLSPSPLSPGNYEVSKIFVVDWEVCNIGVPGIDIGQFCAEVNNLGYFHPTSKVVIDALLQSFMETYRSEFSFGFDDSDGMQKALARARRSLIHWGMHSVVWTARSGWGDDTIARSVVKRGVEMILVGHRGEEEELRQSVVGGLLV